MTDPGYLHDSGKVFLATENYIIYGDSVLMHRRSKTKDANPGLLLGPGGRMDQNEDVITSAVREVREETGLELDPKSIELKAVAIHRYPAHGTVWISFITRIQLADPPGPITDSEEGTNQWVKISDLKTQSKVFPVSKYYHDHVLTPRPGILYTNLEWDNDKPKHTSSVTVPSGSS